MVRLDDEERREAAIFEKSGRLLLARPWKFGCERRMEIHRQLRQPDRESENAFSRFEKWRRERCFPVRLVRYVCHKITQSRLPNHTRSAGRTQRRQSRTRRGTRD